jgi:hypothetical protein
VSPHVRTEKLPNITRTEDLTMLHQLEKNIMNGGLERTVAEVMSYFKANYNTGVCLQELTLMFSRW